MRMTLYEVAQVHVLHTFEPVLGQFRDETECLHPLPLVIDAVVDGTDERLGRRTHDAVVDELPLLLPGLRRGQVPVGSVPGIDIGES